MRDVTTLSFATDVLGRSLPVLVYFWAPWCNPCQTMAPVVEALANDYEGRLAVCRINTDDHPEIQRRYQTDRIPTFLVFRGGRLVRRMIGHLPTFAIRHQLDVMLTAEPNKCI